MKPRVNVYIDGYNWYHAVFKHHPEWKWLDVYRFFVHLRPHEEISAVKFFSALVDENMPGSAARERQSRYLEALRTLPGTEVILGKFQNRTVRCRASCREEYVIQEEKKTDVNIAVQILGDVFFDRCDHVIVVSGDSDLQPPVEWIARHHPQKRAQVYIPALASEQSRRRLDLYARLGVRADFLPLNGLAQCQMPNCVKRADGTFSVRPSTWARASDG